MRALEDVSLAEMNTPISVEGVQSNTLEFYREPKKAAQ